MKDLEIPGSVRFRLETGWQDSHRMVNNPWATPVG